MDILYGLIYKTLTTGEWRKVQVTQTDVEQSWRMNSSCSTSEVKEYLTIDEKRIQKHKRAAKTLEILIAVF